MIMISIMWQRETINVNKVHALYLFRTQAERL